jgi:DNA-binding protein HU-beta
MFHKWKFDVDSKNITKADIVEIIANNIGLTKVETKAVVEGFIDTIIDTIAEGKRIELRGFGVFKHKPRKPRMARNPKTGEEVKLDKRYVPVFKVSPEFFSRVNDSIKSGKGEK